MHYRATFYYQAPDRPETDSEIIFCADSDVDAVTAAWRWWNGRVASASEWFGPLHCIKLGPMFIQPVQENGQCMTGNVWPFYEWKCDWPFAVQDAIEHAAGNWRPKHGVHPGKGYEKPPEAKVLTAREQAIQDKAPQLFEMVRLLLNAIERYENDNYEGAFRGTRQNAAELIRSIPRG